MMNIENIDTEKPIFAYYVDIEGISRQRAEEMIGSLVKKLELTDLQCIIIPNKEKTTIECIYGGKYHTLNDKSFQTLIDKFDEITNSSVTNPLKDQILTELQSIKTLVERNHLIDELI